MSVHRWGPKTATMHSCDHVDTQQRDAPAALIDVLRMLKQCREIKK